MRILLPFLALWLQRALLVSSTPPLPLLGFGYPPPTDLTSNSSLVRTAWSNLTTQIESYIRANTTIEGLVPNLGSYTFSISAFSIHDPLAAETLQYHHTGADVKSSDTGDTQANGDSVYRVASITKLVTVYLTLIKIGSGYWDRPITDFVPELAALVKKKTTNDAIDPVDWKSVTLGALAGQIAGIPRDIALFGSELLVKGDAAALTPPFPSLNLTSPSDVDPCFPYANVSDFVCPRAPWMQAFDRRAPVFSPWATPMYTNGGFALLSLAVENITGQPFSSSMKNDLFIPLNMSSSFYNKLTNLSHAVVPGGGKGSNLEILQTPATNDAASGGIFSSTADLAKLGISMLKSTLISPLETRKWFKPISHSNSLTFSVGRPWEIFRMPLPITNRAVDLYTKAGDAPGYSSYIILSPDYGVGFSILIAGNSKTADTVNGRSVMADTLTNALIPALEAQAAKETLQNFAGTYTSSSPTLNSSLTLAVDQVRGSGLVVESWISNGTSVIPFNAANGDLMSLFPTDLRTPSRYAFRVTYSKTAYTQDVGPFARGVTTDSAWAFMDITTYGGAGVDLFIFSTDREGKVEGILPAATRAFLKRDG